MNKSTFKKVEQKFKTKQNKNVNNVYIFSFLKI